MPQRTFKTLRQDQLQGPTLTSRTPFWSNTQRKPQFGSFADAEVAAIFAKLELEQSAPATASAPPPTTPKTKRRPRGSPREHGIPSPPKPPEQAFHSFLCLDVESTCIDSTAPRYAGLSADQRRQLTWWYPSEVIEWPVVLLQWRRLLDGRWELVEIDRYKSHVKPSWKPTLSDFCTDLTGISQSQVDAAPSLPEVLTHFHETFVRRHNLFTSQNLTLWVTDGPWDLRDHLAKSIHLSPFPQGSALAFYLRFPLTFIDLRLLVPLFCTRNGLLPPTSPRLLDSLSALGLAFEGREHCGLDDAVNVGRCLTAMVDISARGLHERRWILKGNRTLDGRAQSWEWMRPGGQCAWTDPAGEGAWDQEGLPTQAARAEGFAGAEEVQPVGNHAWGAPGLITRLNAEAKRFTFFPVGSVNVL